jgi:hypothetical protein
MRQLSRKPLQSGGKLSYLDFIGLVKFLWEQSHPNIPIKPSAPDEYDLLVDNEYIIVYDIELKKSANNEPKPRMRYAPDDQNVLIYGQRFQIFVGFTVIAKIGTAQDNEVVDAQIIEDTAVGCDAIIEEFEDFILEHVPIFKALGVNELVYARRVADSEVMRRNRKLHKRKVIYSLTTEKTFRVEQTILDSILVRARTQYFERSIAPPEFLGFLERVSDLPKSSSNVGDYYIIDEQKFYWSGFEWYVKLAKSSIIDEFKSATPDS